MRTPLAAALLAILTTSTAVRADDSSPHLDLHVGFGLPAGGVGLGVRMGAVELLAEGEIMGAAFVMAMSGSVHLNVDVLRRPRYSLYTGAFAASLFVLAGSDEVFEEHYNGGGAVLGLRIHHRSGSMSHAIETGAMYGRCADQMCTDGEAFVSLDLAYRLHFHLF